MADALMNWETRRARWRKKYKGKWLQISASDLGGTTATDTKLAANHWYREQQVRIDGELALETPRSNEWWAYRAELESVQTTIKALTTAMRVDPGIQFMLAPNVELLKHKEKLLKEALQQDELPPLDDFLRNPIYVSPATVEELAVKDAKDVLRKGRVLSPHEIRSIRVVDGKEYIVRKMATYDGYGKSKEIMLDVEEVIDERLNQVVGVKDKMLARRKREAGLIPNESDRGQMIQIVKADGIEVAESRKLEYHIEKYLEARKQDCKLGKIAPGRLKKINRTLDIYKGWSPIVSSVVDRIGTKEHIEAYHSFLAKRVLAGEIKPKYANDLFGEFKTLINWLVKEEVLKEFPRCLQLKGNGYQFSVVRQKPKVVPLEIVHRILNAANPRLKLFVLLTLNCGFGASEIGKLEKDEYDSATGRITHRRCKTEKSDSTPTVCYKFWDITKELLNQEIENRKSYPKHSESKKYLLVNTNGKPLWSESVDTGKSDNISSAFKRLIVKLRKADSAMPQVAYYQFRKTSATLIFNKSEFTRLDWLWLGHAPNTMAGQSYSAAENEILDRCIDWLHDRIFDAESPSESPSEG